jgi:hypothetical protein
MPAKAEWLLRLPEILVALRVLDIPVVDRPAIQRLFGFQRRRAVAARVKILVEPGVWDTRIRSLPAGIRLEPGSLRVEFRDPQELLQKALRLGPGDCREL